MREYYTKEFGFRNFFPNEDFYIHNEEELLEMEVYVKEKRKIYYPRYEGLSLEEKIQYGYFTPKTVDLINTGKLSDPESDNEYYEVESNVFNPQIIDEVFVEFLSIKEVYANYKFKIEKIKLKLINLLDSEEKTRVVKKLHSKYLSKLVKNELYFSLYDNSDELSITDENLIEKFKKYLKNESDMFIDYLCEESAEYLNERDDICDEYNTEFDISNYELFQLYIGAKDSLEICNFLKEFMEQNIRKENGNYNQLKRTKSYDIYKSDVFKSLEGENLFMYLLEKTGVIRIDGALKMNKIQPVCDAIFIVDHYDSNRIIFKEVLEKKEYIEYINNRFEAKITNPNKLSIGTAHVTMVNKYIGIYLKSEK